MLLLCLPAFWLLSEPHLLLGGHGGQGKKEGHACPCRRQGRTCQA